MAKCKIGDRVKIRKDSQFHHQAPNLFGEIIGVREARNFPYKTKFSNGYINSYRETDLELVEEPISLSRNPTRQEIVDEAIRKYSPIKIGDWFNSFSIGPNEPVKSDDPSKWAFTSNKLYLAEVGDGGPCVYFEGRWADKIVANSYEEPFTLPEKWAVECNADCDSTPELLDWRLNKSDHNCKWSKKGYIQSSGYKHDHLLSSFTLITYQQFLDHVHHPWKKSIGILNGGKPMQPTIDDTIKVGDMVEVVHISPTDDEWKPIGKVNIPFKVGAVHKVTRIGNGFEIAGGYNYPKSMFKKVVKKEETSSDMENLTEYNGVKVGDVVIIGTSLSLHKKGDVVVISKIVKEKGFVKFFTPELEKEYPKRERWLSPDHFEKIDLVGRKVKVLKKALSAAGVEIGDILTIIRVNVGSTYFTAQKTKNELSWCFNIHSINKPDGLELLPIGSDDDIDSAFSHVYPVTIPDFYGTISITNAQVESKNSIKDVSSLNVLLKPKKKIKLKID